MNGQRPSRRRPTQPWKTKMGVEFSGLERPRDFMVAFLFLAGFFVVAAILAFVAFG